MAQPVGYFSLDHDNSLIHDMTEQWGEDLSGMSGSDILWLIGRLGHEAWLEDENLTLPSAGAEAVACRLQELKQWEKLALIRALTQ